MTWCVGALYPDRHAADIRGRITCGEGEPLEVARTILQSGDRKDLSTTIRPRYSRTASGTYISNGCLHCDAIQGAYFIEDAVTETVTATGVFNADALVTLMVGPCPSFRRQTLHSRPARLLLTGRGSWEQACAKTVTCPGAGDGR